ncbi:MAG TPA: sugar phosphate isomerase/epimerase [Bacteroidales bacterium]|nr:sugar phosphate isomerase/epimerase [Bacteroidales bacterium]
MTRRHINEETADFQRTVSKITAFPPKGSIKLGINMEFVRHHDMCFADGVRKAAEIGYEYIEPMVHLGRELLSEAGYFHSVSMYDDPLWIKELCSKHNVKLSGLSAHTPLCKPEIGVEYLKMAVRWAAEAGAPVVNTDEGPKPFWTTKEMDYQLMKYTLTEASMVAERRGIKIGIEPHQQYSKDPDGLDTIYNLVKSPAIGINYDTGNSYLAGGSDVYEWLERVKDRLVHLHAKDISISQSARERGKVTGTPVGCACGEGVVDWKRVIDIVRSTGREIVFSVECGTIDQAVKSFRHLSALI